MGARHGVRGPGFPLNGTSPDPTDRARQRRSVWLLWSVALLATAIPVVVAPFIPLQDWPQHVANVEVLARYGSPGNNYADFYVRDGSVLATFRLFYFGAAWLARLLSSEVAGRVFLIGYLVGTPLSLAYLFRAYGRSAQRALLSVPMVWSWPFFLGFLPFLVTMPLFFLAIGLAERLLAAPSVRRLFLLSLTACGVFFGHALLFALLTVVLAILAMWTLLRRERRRSVLWLIGGCLPACALFCGWVTRTLLADSIERVGESIAAASRQAEPYYFTAAESLAALPRFANEGFQGDSDLWLLVAWCVSVLLAAVTIIWKRRSPDAGAAPESPSAPPIRGALLPILFLMLYFVVPMFALGAWGVSARLVTLAALSFPLLLPFELRRPSRRVLLSFAGPSVALSVVAGAMVTERFLAFGDEAAGFDAVLDALPAEQRLYGLIYDKQSAIISHEPYLHFPAYYTANRGGVTGWSFAHNNPSMPLFRRGFAELPAPSFGGHLLPERWRYGLYAPYYDVVLVRGAGSIGERIAAPEGALELLARDGDWSAYRLLGHPDERPLWSMVEVATSARVDAPDRTSAVEVRSHAMGRTTVACVSVAGGVALRYRGPWAGVVRLRGYAITAEQEATVEVALDEQALLLAELGAYQHTFFDEPLPEPTDIELLTVRVADDAGSPAQACINVVLLADPR